jgi:hypothetical protein
MRPTKDQMEQLDREHRQRAKNWKRMSELREALFKRGDPLHYIERGKMFLGWSLRLGRLPQ